MGQGDTNTRERELYGVLTTSPELEPPYFFRGRLYVVSGPGKEHILMGALSVETSRKTEEEKDFPGVKYIFRVSEPEPPRIERGRTKFFIEPKNWEVGNDPEFGRVVRGISSACDDEIKIQVFGL